EIIDPGVDIAVRTREYEADSSVTVRRLAQARFLPVASPAYLTEHGRPSVPKDLERHPTLLYGFSREIQTYRFRKGEQIETVHLRPAILSTEGRVLCAAALADGGILIQPNYTIYDDCQVGRLVPILEDWELPPVVIHLAFHTRKHQPAKIRVFIDFLVDYFDKMEYERKWMS